jgi:hypothetical protein
MQNNYKRLLHAFDKSTIANFPSHEVESGKSTRDSLVTGCHDQSQPLYEMPMDTYPGQPQPRTHIGGKSTDLRRTGPCTHERGSSGPATTGLVFRNELPRPAPEPPHTAQTLNDPFGPSAYSAGWSGCMTGQSGAEYIESYESNCYPNPHPWQLNFPSHHTSHQHHNITSKTRGVSTFRLLEGRKGAASPMSRIGRVLMRHKTQANGEEDHILISKQPQPCWTREPVDSQRLLLI